MAFLKWALADRERKRESGSFTCITSASNAFCDNDTQQQENIPKEYPSEIDSMFIQVEETEERKVKLKMTITIWIELIFLLTKITILAIDSIWVVISLGLLIECCVNLKSSLFLLSWNYKLRFLYFFLPLLSIVYFFGLVMCWHFTLTVVLLSHNVILSDQRDQILWIIISSRSSIGFVMQCCCFFFIFFSWQPWFF